MHVTIQLKYHTIKSEQKCTNVKLKDKWLNNTKIIHKNMIQKQFIIRVMITYYLYDFISETYKSDQYLPPSSNSNATKGQWKKTWNNGNPFKPATLTSAHQLTWWCPLSWRFWNGYSLAMDWNEECFEIVSA